MRADYATDYPELYLQIESIASQANALLASLDNAKDSTTGGFNVVLAATQLSTLTASISTLDLHMRALGVGTVTNLLGYIDGSDMMKALWDEFDERHDNGYGGIYVIPYTEDDQQYSDLLTHYLTYSTSPGSYYTVAETTYGILGWLHSHESDLTDAGTTNLLTHQNTILSSNQTTIASVYEKLDALESTPTDEEIQESTDADTYTNAVPTAPLQLGSVDVDTSSMESVLDPISDGLEGLIPTESTTKPKIMMMQGRGNRAGGNVEVELDLTGLEAVTRILRVLYKVGLWVGVIGILRSEWAYWSTLGGSAT